MLRHLIAPLAGLSLGGYSRRDSAGADNGEKCFLNGVIDPQAAKGNATRLAIVHPAAAAAVARDVMLRARVAKRARSGGNEAGPPAKRRRAWAHRDGGWWGTLLLTILRIVSTFSQLT